MEEKIEQNLEAEAQNAVDVCNDLEALRFLVGVFNDASRKVIDCEFSDLEKCYSKAKSVYVTLSLLHEDIQHKIEISNVLSGVKDIDDLHTAKAMLDAVNTVMDLTYDIRRRTGE